MSGNGTSVVGSSAREYHQHQIHYLRRDFTYLDDGKVLTVGTLPAGAVMHKPMSGVDVQVLFNAGSTNVLDSGTAANDDLYATDLALGTVAFVPLDEAVSMKVTVATTIIATVDLTGTAAGTGQASVVIAYTLPDQT